MFYLRARGQSRHMYVLQVMYKCCPASVKCLVTSCWAEYKCRPPSARCHVMTCNVMLSTSFDLLVQVLFCHIRLSTSVMLVQVMFCQVSTSDLQGREHPGCCVRCNMTPVVAWLPRDNTNVGHHVITSTRKQSTSTWPRPKRETFIIKSI